MASSNASLPLATYAIVNDKQARRNPFVRISRIACGSRSIYHRDVGKDGVGAEVACNLVVNFAPRPQLRQVKRILVKFEGRFFDDYRAAACFGLSLLPAECRRPAHAHSSARQPATVAQFSASCSAPRSESAKIV